MRQVVFPSVLFVLLFPFGTRAAAQASPAQTAMQSPQVTFHAATDLVLIDVIALQDGGVPDKALSRGDFQVFDNGHPVSIKTFDIGTQGRPLALWFLVQCTMEGWDREGSGLFHGQIALFKPALRYLDKQDTVGVAHWCDNGDAQLDLQPTTQIDTAMTALEQVLAPGPSTVSYRPGELALQRTLQLIVDASRAQSPQPLPVVVFLYGDQSGMPREEADHFVDELLATSAIVFGLKDRRSPGIWLLGEQAQIAKYIAKQTGGEYLRVTPEAYAKGLEQILEQLHFRYELGFEPATLDGKRHKLEVKLVSSARSQHKQVHLRYRSGYIAIRSTKEKSND